jgi:hypothetical protein
MATTRTGLLIIRTWTEEASTHPLRARIRLTTDVANGFESEVTVADVKDVCLAVEAWLHAIMEVAQTTGE